MGSDIKQILIDSLGILIPCIAVIAVMAFLLIFLTLIEKL